MKRALFVWSEAGGLGGVATFIRHCCARMPGLGWHVEWLGTRGALESGAGLHAWRTGGRTTEAGLRRRMTDLVAAASPDLLVFHETFDAEDVIDALPRPLPAVNVMHNCRPDDRYYALGAELATWGAWTACVSETTRTGVAGALGGRVAPPVETLHLGVEPDADACARGAVSDAVRIVYAGRLDEEQKNVGELVLLADALDAAGVRYRMRIAGDGPARELLVAGFGARVAAGVVVFEGRLDHADVLKLFAASDVFVLTSNYEGLPLAMLEAMGQGCVPVVSDIACGIRDVVEQGRNGCRFTPHDPAAGARCIADLVRRPGALAGCSSAAIGTARLFSLDAALARYVAFFERAVVAAPVRNPASPPRGGLSLRKWFTRA